MKGLLKKDFYVLLSQMKMYLVLILVFSVLPGMNLSSFAIAYCGMLPYTAMAYDERSHWDSLAVMMPYTPADLVLSKYILGWILMLCATIITTAANLLLAPMFSAGNGFSLAAMLPSFCLGAVVMAVTLPPMFRFGVEKGRLFFLILMIGVVGAGTGLIQEAFTDAGQVVAAWRSLTLLGIPLLALVLTVISVPLSIRFYTRRAMS